MNELPGKSIFEIKIESLRRNTNSAIQFAGDCMDEVFYSDKFRLGGIDHNPIISPGQVRAMRFVVLKGNTEFVSFFVPFGGGEGRWRRDMETMAAQTETLKNPLIELNDTQEGWKALQTTAIQLAQEADIETLAAMLMTQDRTNKVNLIIFYPKAFMRLAQEAEEGLALSVSALFLKKIPFDKSLPITNTPG